MAIRLLRQFQLYKINHSMNFHTSRKSLNFYEIDRKSGMPMKSDYVEEPKTILQRIREGYQQLKEESKLLMEEMKENLRMDPMFHVPPDEVDIKWKFNDSKKIHDDWVVTCDSDYSYGHSTATLQLTSNGTALFSGVIDPTPIRDGRIQQAGFCNIKSVEPRKAFYRSQPHDWSMYSHLVLRVRGDGRSYFLNLQPATTFDIMWNDLHHYVLYTRGGPYWQYVRIPFSKFFLSNRGRIQDHQGRIRTHAIKSVGITAADGIAGPFSLELDFIGVENDISFVEEFAYELYASPHPYYI